MAAAALCLVHWAEEMSHLHIISCLSSYALKCVFFLELVQTDSVNLFAIFVDCPQTSTPLLHSNNFRLDSLEVY